MHKLAKTKHSIQSGAETEDRAGLHSAQFGDEATLRAYTDHSVTEKEVKVKAVQGKYIFSLKLKV